MKHVLVAGATGYLGGFVAQEFKARGYFVRALARSPEKLDHLQGSLDEIVEAEVTRPETLEQVCDDIDVVFSSIGITRQKDGLTFRDVDYQGNKNLLEAAVNVYDIRIYQGCHMSNEDMERTSAKKEQIVLTGDLLFSRHGLRRVTVEEICREAGVSKMTFYKYFPNKLELFKHIWNRWSDTIYERLLEMEGRGASFMERMKAITEFKVELVSRMNPELIEDIIHAGPELEKFIQDLRARSMKRFFEFFSDAQEKGEMRRIRPEFLVTVLAHLGELIKDDGLRRLYPTDLEFIREVNDFFFFGIMPAGEEREE